MIIAVTERATWKRCRRKWKLSSETQDNLEVIKMVKVLQLGTMVQECLSHWQEHPDTDPVKTFARISKTSIQKYSDDYLASIGAPISDEELDPMFEVIEKGLAMVKNYATVYSKPLPKDFKLIQTEQRIMVAIPDTKHWECNTCHWMLLRSNLIDDNLIQKPESEWSMSIETTNVCPRCGERAVTWQSHYLRGTMDSLLQDPKGKIYPLERKTYGKRPDPDKLSHDDQMLAYLWILVMLFGYENVGGVLYDGLWSRAQPPAKRGANPQLALKDLFYRDIFPRSREEIAEFGQLLKYEVDDMAESIMNDRIYINRTWMGCHLDCGMNKLCSAMSKGEDTQYIKDTFYKQRVYGTILPADEDE